MRRHLFGLGLVVVIFGGLWLLCFGTASPCDAMRATGLEVAESEGGETGKLIRESMSPKTDYSTIQCIGLTLHMRISGKGAFKIVGR